MPTTSFDHPAFESALSAGADAATGAADAIDTSIGTGLDPQTANDLTEGQAKTATTLREAADNADTGRDASSSAADTAEDSAAGVAAEVDDAPGEKDAGGAGETPAEGTRPVGEEGTAPTSGGGFDGIPGLHEGGSTPPSGTEGLSLPSPGPLADSPQAANLDAGYYDAQRLDDAQREAAAQAQRNAMAQAQAYNTAMSQAQASEAQARAMQAATAQQLLAGQGLAQGGASPAGVAAALAAMDSAASGPDYASTGDPTSAATSTQYDLNHAGNAEELREEIYQQLRDAYERGELDLSEYMEPDGEAPGRVSEATEKAAIQLAQDYAAAGIPYAWGGGHGAEPGISQGTTDGGVADSFGDYMKQGLDCSGLSRDYIYNLYGIDIGGTAADQMGMGVEVSLEDAKPGDLWFPHDGHVGVYIGNGQILEAPQSGEYVKISEMRPGMLRRINPDTI